MPKRRIHRLFDGEKEFWAKFANLSDIRLWLSSSRQIPKRQSTNFYGFFMIDSIGEWNRNNPRETLDESEFWSTYIRNKTAHTTKVLIVSIFAGVLCIFLVCSHMADSDIDIREDSGRSFFLNDAILWAVVNAVVTVSIQNIDYICEHTSRSISYSWGYLGYLLIGFRVVITMTRIIWSVSAHGSTLAVYKNTKSSPFFIILAFANNLFQTAIFALMPFPWPWALIAALFEFTIKFFVIMSVKNLASDNDDIKHYIKYALLLSISITIFTSSCAALCEMSAKNIFINSRLHENSAKRKFNFISLLCSELRVPLQLITHASINLVLPPKEEQQYQKILLRNFGNNKLINLFAESILLMTRFHEQRFDPKLNCVSINVQGIVDEVVSSPSVDLFPSFKAHLFVSINLSPGLEISANSEVFSLLISNIVHFGATLVRHTEKSLQGSPTAISYITSGTNICAIAFRVQSTLSTRTLELTLQGAAIQWSSSQAFFKQSIHYLVMDAIVNQLNGDIKVVPEQGLLVIQLTNLVALKGDLDALLQAQQKTLFKFDDQRSNVSEKLLASMEVFNSMEIQVLGLLSDYQIESCIRDLILDINLKPVTLDFFSEAIDENFLRMIERQEMNNLILFSDSMETCAQLYAIRRDLNAKFIIIQSSFGLVYHGESSVDSYCDYQLSIPCEDKAKIAFQQWIALEMQKRFETSNNAPATILTTTYKNLNNETGSLGSRNSSLFLSSRTSRQFMIILTDIIELCNSLYTTFMESLLWFGYPRFDKELENFFFKWLFDYTTSRNFDPKPYIYGVQVMLIVFANVTHYAIGGKGVLSCALSVVYTVLFLFRGYIERNILRPLKISQLSFWTIVGLLVLVMFTSQLVISLYCLSLDKDASVSQTSRVGILNGYSVLELVISGSTLVISRAFYFPYPWNVAVIVACTVRSSILIVFGFQRFMNGGEIFLLVILIISLGICSLLDTLEFHHNNRSEFVALREKIFGDIFLENYITLWQTECKEPIASLLTSKKVILQLLYMNSGITKEFLRKYDSVNLGYQRLSSLSHMIACKESLLTSTSSTSSASTSQPSSLTSNISTNANANVNANANATITMIYPCWEIKRLCRSFCNSVSFSDSTFTFIIEVHPNVSRIRTDRDIFLSVISYAINRAILYIQNVIHAVSKLSASRSHDILLTVRPDEVYLKNHQHNQKFHDPRPLLVEIIHPSLDIDAWQQEDIMNRCDFGIGSIVYEQVLDDHLSRFGCGRALDDSHSYTVRRTASDYRGNIVQDIRITYFQLPTFDSQLQLPKRHLVYCASMDQQIAFDKYSQFRVLCKERKMQINNSSSSNSSSSSSLVNTPSANTTTPVAATSITTKSTKSTKFRRHGYCMLFVTSSLELDESIEFRRDETKHMVRALQQHGWRFDAVPVHQLSTVHDLTSFDCILLDYDMISDYFTTEELNHMNCDNVIGYLKSMGYDKYFAELNRCSSSKSWVPNGRKQPSIIGVDLVVSLPLLTMNIDELVDRCGSLAIFGRGSTF